MSLTTQKCKRCNGQTYIETDVGRKYLTCIQCGSSELLKGEENAVKVCVRDGNKNRNNNQR